jgi:hypothetical protein
VYAHTAERQQSVLAVLAQTKLQAAANQQIKEKNYSNVKKNGN